MSISQDDARRLLRYAESMRRWGGASHSSNGEPITLRGETYRRLTFCDNPAMDLWMKRECAGAESTVNDLLLVLELNEEAAK